MPDNDGKEPSGGDLATEHLRQDLVEVRENLTNAQASIAALENEMKQRPTRYQIAAICLTLVLVSLTPAAIVLSAFVSAINPAICNCA